MKTPGQVWVEINILPKVGKDAFTYELSDHLPLWVQINTDNDGHQLDQIIKVKKEV